MIRWAVLFCAAFAAPGAAALDVPSTARLVREDLSEQDVYDLPVAAFDGGAVPVQSVQGAVKKQAWQIPGAGLTSLQILEPLRAQLASGGYDAVLDCAGRQCGGFDFRFGIEVLPAPDMYVNLRDFHFLSMVKGDAVQPVAAVTVLVSRARETAYVQIVEVVARGKFTERRKAPQTTVPTKTSRDDGPYDLLTRGSVVLEGLEFETGATRLGPGPFEALTDLADYLKANPGLRVALVGHTDSVGSLQSNIEISRKRARAVRARLIDVYGIPPAQLDAEGMGYLAPRASNLSEAGREANRRVEAIALTAN